MFLCSCVDALLFFQKVDHELSSEYSEEMDDVLGALEALTAGLGESELKIVSGDERIRSIYEEWCHENKKEIDETRYVIFSENFLNMEALGKSLELHDWFDRTEEEYIALNTKKLIKERTLEPIVEVSEVDGVAKQMDIAKKEAMAIDKSEVLDSVEVSLEEKKVKEKEKTSLISATSNGDGTGNASSNMSNKYSGDGVTPGTKSDSLSDAFESIFGKKPDGPVHAFDSKNGKEAKFAAEVEAFLKIAEKERFAEAEAVAKATYEAKKAEEAALASMKKKNDQKAAKAKFDILKMQKKKKASMDIPQIPAKKVIPAPKNDEARKKKPLFDINNIIDGAKKIANAAAEANAKAKERARLMQAAEEEAKLREAAGKSSHYIFPHILFFYIVFLIYLLFVVAESEMRQRALLESRHQLEATDREKVARVYSIYIEWCTVYGKMAHDSKFRVFLHNFLTMESMAIAAGKTVQLNEWYDCTEEEYIKLSREKTGKDTVQTFVDEDDEEESNFADVIDAEVTHSDADTKEAKTALDQDEGKSNIDEELRVSVEAEALIQIEGKIFLGWLIQML